LIDTRQKKSSTKSCFDKTVDKTNKNYPRVHRLSKGKPLVVKENFGFCFWEATNLSGATNLFYNKKKNVPFALFKIFFFFKASFFKLNLSQVLK
jgi:hypothetical protein